VAVDQVSSLVIPDHGTAQATPLEFARCGQDQGGLAGSKKSTY
jgi:hypothetical protein